MGCRATGAVSCTALLTSSGGGLIGYTVADSGTVAIADCHATGAVEVVVTADNKEFANVGGLVGSYVSTVRSTFTITNCYATGNAAGTAANGNQSATGGLLGYVEIKAGNATIRNSYATGNATASSTNSYTNAGGLLGRAYIYPGTGTATIRNCYAMGNATAGNYGHAGGLVGTTNAGNSSFMITNCYATGNVDATTNVADKIGYDGIIAEGGTVGASYYSGSVTYDLGPGTFEIQGDRRYRTTKQLKALVAGGLDPDDLTKSGWDEKDWNFGTDQELPKLRKYEEDVNGNQVAGKEELGGQEMERDFVPRKTPLGDKVVELEDLLGGPTQDAAVDGSAYQRIKRLVADLEALKQQLGSDYALKSELPTASNLSKYALKSELEAVKNSIPDEPDLSSKANVGASYTKQESDDKYALKSGLTTVPDLSGYALRSELPTVPDLSSKADVGASYTKQESDGKYALKGELPAVPDLSGYALRSELPTVPDLSSKADVGASYTKQESDGKYALKGELPTVPDLSGYALKSELPTVPNLSTPVSCPSKANVGASYTRREADRREATLRAELEALKEALEDLRKRVDSGTGTDSAFATARMETRIVVRPNPVRDKLIVSSPVAVTATLLDSSGQLLLTRQLPRGEQSIDVSGLVAGSYLLVLQTGEGTSSTYKFVKE